ncbi:hypothetical protein AB0D99_16890 [Streptomyces sp. NPDC047971]|uniref:hypothetical protein n=1 Tax=Streptomyces sp. NPDC047971 TaxID=3154499 RepID=UPI0033FCD75A
MRVRQLLSLLAVGAICPLLGACGVDDEKGPEAGSPDEVPCTITVSSIKEGNDIRGGNLSYFVRYRVHVAGEPDFEGAQEPVLNPIQVAQIVAVSKHYSCWVSRSNHNQIQIDWDKPLTASPSATPK